MPLHTHYLSKFATFYSLHYPIVSLCGDNKLWSTVAHSLMMERVYVEFVFAIYSMQHRPFGHRYRMSRLTSISILRVLDGVRYGFRYILNNLAIESHSQSLYATTDAEHRDIAVVSQSRDKKFGKVALSVDMMKLCRWFFVCPQRIIVSTSSKDYGIKTLKGVDDNILIGYGRNNDRNTTRSHYLLVIVVAYGDIYICTITSKANHRAMIGLRESRIDIIEMRR